MTIIYEEKDDAPDFVDFVGPVSFTPRMVSLVPIMVFLEYMMYEYRTAEYCELLQESL